MKRSVRRLALAVSGVTAALLAAAPAATAETGYHVFDTGIGIYPRVEPSMDSAKTGIALGDGTPLDIVCQTTGTPFGGNDVFNRLADGTYLPDRHTYTGFDGFDPRLPRCQDTPAAEPVESTPASAWTPYCGKSKYVEKIEVVPWAGGHFQIVLTPTLQARSEAVGPDPHATVVEQWHAVQNCVAGLYNDLADSIWDQLECHQALSWIMWNREGSMWATGDTYELESWRPKLIRDFPRLPQYLVTECGNNLGLKPAGPFRSPIRPDLGVVDLQGAADAIA